jgi:hypothetical protein
LSLNTIKTFQIIDCSAVDLCYYILEEENVSISYTVKEINPKICFMTDAKKCFLRHHRFFLILKYFDILFRWLLNRNRSRVTSQHHEEMVSFMERNPEFAQLKFNSSAGREKSKQLWQDLVNRLNSIDTCQKPIKGWMDVGIFRITVYYG